MLALDVLIWEIRGKHYKRQLVRMNIPQVGVGKGGKGGKVGNIELCPQWRFHFRYYHPNTILSQEGPFCVFPRDYDLPNGGSVIVNVEYLPSEIGLHEARFRMLQARITPP